MSNADTNPRDRVEALESALRGADGIDMILQATPSAARLIIESVLNRALEVGRAGDDLLSNELLAIGEDLADQAQLPNIPEPERIEQ